jgi:hypothetical protein
MLVDRISGALSTNIDLIDARALAVNRKPKRFFQGQTPQNSAFVLTPEEAARLVAADPRSADVIHPYLIGKEIGKHAKPTRFVIDIPDDDIAKAKRYRGAFEHARAHVLPMREAAAEREKQDNAEKLAADPTARVNKHDANFLKRWWQLGYRRTDMLSAIGRIDRYAALSRVAVENKPSVWCSSMPRSAPATRCKCSTSTTSTALESCPQACISCGSANAPPR